MLIWVITFLVFRATKRALPPFSSGRVMLGVEATVLVMDIISMLDHGLMMHAMSQMDCHLDLSVFE